MEYEFDKEIDSLLRQARPENNLSGKSNAHLDADEISLFAENALAKNARMRVTEHLADCAKCRNILSSVIALNAETASEIVHTEEAKTVITEAAIPWYRKIFAFPQLAYTMGGLTVLLAGMIGYVALQSYDESKNASLAQMESIERPRGTSGADSEGETVTVETYSANTATASNISNAAVTANTASNAATSKTSAPGSGTANSNTATSATKDETAVAPPAPAPAAANNLAEREQSADDKSAETTTNYSTDGAARAGSPPTYQQNSVTRNQPIMPDSRNVQSRQVENLPMTARAPRVLQTAPPSADNDAPKEKAEKKSEAEKSKSVGGKDFVYKDSVWYDKSYKQQKTVNVRRNSDDYKKLDSAVRSIADNLEGTIVIVWNGKAYRIQ